ncbi:NAD(P)/FAD-dependent oxidoreductase [Actinopolymorpha alba]|uniref:FAD/NAD(P)-dependent oxidoreductase n=1 Tax=Actinopolymorpha alba TaxID=533267 RepID=UPI00036EAE36|nr:NAD(P)/FAD-dependent oxidoreductase [Actinopolymorpha alba]
MASSPVDVCVVGAGPAGLTAAVAAATAGRTVALVDAGARPGGQFWRHSPAGIEADRALHHDFVKYRQLETGLARFVQTGQIRLLTRHQVWTIERGARFTVRALKAGEYERTVDAAALVLAPGAYDRQVPLPGWELPGVYTAGGAQALLKEHGVLVGARVLVAGTGPFLLSVAAGLAQRGARVVGVYEANTGLGWLHHRSLRAVVRNFGKLSEGIHYAGTFARHRVWYHPRSTIVAAHGDTEVRAATVARLTRHGAVVPGSERRIEVDAIAVGWGFTPQLELPVALGTRTEVDADGSEIVLVGDWQQSSTPGVFVAGEATGVGGAALARVEGEIAGYAAAWYVNVDHESASFHPRSRRAERRLSWLRKRRLTLRAFAAAMHRAHPVPPSWLDQLQPDTLVCRCEEVSVERLRTAADDLGVTDARLAKLLTRTGMGWCQGRVCGYATACLVARFAGTGYDPRGLTERPLAVPVPLGVLAHGAAPAVPADESWRGE